MTDKLRSRGLSFVSFEEGVALAKEVGALSYVECSALTQVGVKASIGRDVIHISCLSASTALAALFHTVGFGFYDAAWFFELLTILSLLS